MLNATKVYEAKVVLAQNYFHKGCNCVDCGVYGSQQLQTPILAGRIFSYNWK